MDTEPPQGDELQRLLVTMKQEVLDRAAGERPGRRHRRAGIAVGVVSLLLLGAGGGGVALGLIPTTLTAAPTASVTPSPEPSVTMTPSGAPVLERPTPVPTPTSTRPPYSASDPSTWTISGAEVGPIAIGAPLDGELDDLDAAYTRLSPDETGCVGSAVTVWRGSASNLTVVAADGVVQGVLIGAGASGSAPPTTAEGLGVGSTLDEVRAAYPDLVDLGRPDVGSATWSTARGGTHITFVLDGNDEKVVAVWDSAVAEAPYEFCL